MWLLEKEKILILNVPIHYYNIGYNYFQVFIVLYNKLLIDNVLKSEIKNSNKREKITKIYIKNVEKSRKFLT